MRVKRTKLVAGFSIIEMLIVILLIGIIFSAIVGVLVSSDKSWRYGEVAREEQVEARRALDSITKDLRKSSVEWIVNNTSYYITIGAQKDRIDFYLPIFNNSNVTNITATRYWQDTTNRQLLRREGNVSIEVKANNLESCQFDFANPENSVVDVSIEIKKQSGLLQQDRPPYNLQSSVTLRNLSVTLSNSTYVEEIPD